MGPVASQEAIKMLGTNGGGFFNANSAHPYENPTALTNFLQMSEEGGQKFWGEGSDLKVALYGMLNKVKSDSVRADSLARVKETEVLRETFTYSGASRDPFQSVIAAGTSGPDVGDLQLVAIYADVRSARNSVAVLRERQGARRWRVRIGDHIGTATVSLITLRDVTFTIQDFGFERQETLSLRKLTEDTP
jgi:hypothetical protein